ncbi:MAG: sugar ABC transporter permease, partial [Pseudomonadota bacterium]
MSATHGKAMGGYIWRVAEPVGGIALFSYVCSLAFRAPSLGESFAIYFTAGFLPYVTFNDVQSRVASSINFSKSLLAYPAVTFVDAILARFLLAFFTQVVVFYIIVTGVELLLETGTDYRFPRIFAAMSMAAVLG